MAYLLISDSEGSELLSKIGSWKIFKFLGDTSYGLYLVHLLVLYPVVYLLYKQSWYVSQGDNLRFGVAFIIVTPVVYLVAFILHRTVEKNGIRLSKEIIRRIHLPQ